MSEEEVVILSSGKLLPLVAMLELPRMPHSDTGRSQRLGHARAVGEKEREYVFFLSTAA